MTQKILKVGSSAAVTLSPKTLQHLGLKIGDPVEVVENPEQGNATINGAKGLSKDDARIARLGMNFINRYRKDLEALAQK